MLSNKRTLELPLVQVVDCECSWTCIYDLQGLDPTLAGLGNGGLENTATLNLVDLERCTFFGVELMPRRMNRIDT